MLRRTGQDQRLSVSSVFSSKTMLLCHALLLLHTATWINGAGLPVKRSVTVDAVNCLQGGPAGPPANLSVQLPYSANPHSFNIIVRWADPEGMAECDVRGYRLLLGRGKGNPIWLHSFQFSRNYSATSQIGENRVTLGTNPSASACPSCLLISLMTTKALFHDEFFTIKLTTQPADLQSGVDSTALNANVVFSVDKCDSPTVDCLNGFVDKFYQGGGSCPNLLGKGTEPDCKLICKCAFRHVFNITTVALTTNSVQLSWRWGYLARSYAKVTLFVLVYASQAHLDADFWDSIPGNYPYVTVSPDLTSNVTTGSRTLKLPIELKAGMVVSIKAYRMDDNTGIYTMKSSLTRTAVVLDENGAVPEMDLTQYESKDTDSTAVGQQG